VDTNDLPTSSSSRKSLYMWLGIALNVIGLLGHVFAAYASGGYTLAYQHHIAGFVGGVIVFGVIFGLLGWRFWKGRRDITVLIVGILSAIFGVLVYATTHNVRT